MDVMGLWGAPTSPLGAPESAGWCFDGSHRLDYGWVPSNLPCFRLFGFSEDYGFVPKDWVEWNPLPQCLERSLLSVHRLPYPVLTFSYLLKDRAAGC